MSSFGQYVCPNDKIRCCTLCTKWAPGDTKGLVLFPSFVSPFLVCIRGRYFYHSDFFSLYSTTQLKWFSQGLSTLMLSNKRLNFFSPVPKSFFGGEPLAEWYDDLMVGDLSMAVLSCFILCSIIYCIWPRCSSSSQAYTWARSSTHLILLIKLRC